MCLAQGPQRSDACEAQTRGSSVSSQALYHWATALPLELGNSVNPDHQASDEAVDQSYTVFHQSDWTVWI